MPSNFTKNYNLSRWERTDQVRMEDFNADNAKIDGALKAETDARAAADSVINAALALRGNCQFYSYSYTGNGQCGQANPTVLKFPWRPQLVLVLDNYGIFAALVPNMQYSMALGFSTGVMVPNTWNGNTITIISPNKVDAQLNVSGRIYSVFAFRALS